MKKVGIVLAILLLLAAGFAWHTAKNLNHYAKSSIESMAPKILGVKVKVGSVSLSPWRGTGTIRNLEISNPPGFKNSHMMKLQKFTLGWKWRSIASGPIEITNLEIHSPEVWWEGTVENNNVGKVQKHAQEYKNERGVKSEEKSTNTRKLRIQEFEISDAKAHVALANLPGREFHLTLPPVKLQSLGDTPNEVSSQILSGVTSAIRTEIQNKVMAEVMNTAREQIRERAGEAIRNFLQRRGN